jgi:transcriptional antiterminator RfaH
MHWYIVHTKPRQEKCALDNLQRQGFQCYLPTLPSEKLRQGVLMVTDEPLFPRYLFIRLGQGDSAPSWAPIHSTKGVSRLVSFGMEPAKVADSLVEALRAQEASVQAEPERLFKPGERVRLTEAPFAGIEGIYQMADGERRVMVLIELLSKQVRVRVAPVHLRKVG